MRIPWRMIGSIVGGVIVGLFTAIFAEQSDTGLIIATLSALIIYNGLKDSEL